MLLPEQAFAACVASTGSNFVCSGTNTITQAVATDNANVTTTPAFSIDTTASGGNALTMSGAGAITYNDANASALHSSSTALSVTATGNSGTPGAVTVNTGGAITAGDGYGIFARNSGSGATSITSTGAINAFGDFGIGIGISAQNDATATSLTVNAVSARGDLYGIYVDNGGSGATGITATGAVSGGDTGIYAHNAASATSLTLSTALVSGRYFGIDAQNAGTGATRITTAGDVTASSTGIVVFNGATATDLTVNAGTVTGGQAGRFGIGISATNNGTGATSVTATGAVTGGNGAEGIYVINGTSATSLTVHAAAASADMYGIYADNAGTGATSVTATDTVTAAGISGPGAAGIFARNAASASDLTVNAAAVNSTSYGIYAENRGRGATSITATGAVFSPLMYGIVAVNGQVTFDQFGNVSGAAPSSGTNLMVNAAAVTGGVAGIYVWNAGVGATSITTTGLVATNGDFGSGIGILAQNGATATSLTLRTAAVSGDLYGIWVDNAGRGATSITSTGTVSGGAGGIYVHNAGSATDLNLTTGIVAGRDIAIEVENAGHGATRVSTGDVFATTIGLLVANGAATTDLTVNTGAVTGGRNGSGIAVSNGGTGETRVTSTGLVSAGTNGDGMHVINGSAATSLTVNTASVSGDTYGVYADNAGRGATSITTTGAVTAAGIAGPGADGIFARNSTTATTLTVDAAAVSGGDYGIYAENRGLASTSITARGIVEGGIAGIDLVSTQIAMLRIAGANAEVRNASRDASTAAIVASGGSLTVFNEARLTGTVQLGNVSNLVLNSGVWTTTGTNAFGTGGNTLINNPTGAIVTAVSSAQTETAQFNGLGTFINSGLLSLQDGGAGDTVRFSGNLVSTGGSVQAIDINKAGQSDRIMVDGTATIFGTTLNVANQGGYTVGTRYTVLTATGGLIGTYANITGSGAFIGLVGAYDAHNAYLDVTQARTFAKAALTRNQFATSSSLDSMQVPASDALFKAVVNSTTDDQARSSFDSLSGAVHASAQTALVEDSHFITDSAIDRIRQGFEAVGAPVMPVMSFAPQASPSPAVNAMAYAMPVKALPMRAPEPASTLAIWGQGFGSWGHTDGDGNASRLNRSTGGIITGIDGLVAETWRLGLMAGYSHTNFGVSDGGSSGDSDNYHVGVYGGTQWGPLGFRTGVAYTWHDISTARSVNVPGFADRLKADYNAGTTQVFGELGYRVDIDRVALEPFINVAYVNLHTDGFTESGGLAALTSTGTTIDTTFTTLGLRGATSFMLGTMATTARGNLGWRHAFGDVTPFSTFALSGSSAFSIAGVPVAKEAAVVGAGLDFAVARSTTVSISYGGQFGDKATDQNVRGSLAVRF